MPAAITIMMVRIDTALHIASISEGRGNNIPAIMIPIAAADAKNNAI